MKRNILVLLVVIAFAASISFIGCKKQEAEKPAEQPKVEAPAAPAGEVKKEEAAKADAPNEAKKDEKAAGKK